MLLSVGLAAALCGMLGYTVHVPVLQKLADGYWDDFAGWGGGDGNGPDGQSPARPGARWNVAPGASVRPRDTLSWESEACWSSCNLS